jgi:bifunctional DNA-binding transcriptional regulator/antitoxin component of YhaV-PrlF toxin-antitoxin module
MTETVVLDKSGSFIFSEAIRNELGLKTGDRLTVIASESCIRILAEKDEVAGHDE